MAVSIYIEAAQRRQLEPLVATTVFSLKCSSSPRIVEKPKEKQKTMFVLGECVLFVYKVIRFSCTGDSHLQGDTSDLCFCISSFLQRGW